MNNVISLLKEDLHRHKVTVTLPGENEKKDLFLIIISAKVNQLKDFSTTYGGSLTFGGSVTTLHLRLAEKIFGNKETENDYGVFVDKELKMIFAFNLNFADYDKEKEIIIYKDIDDVLLVNVKTEKKESSSSVEVIRRNFRGGSNAVFKYSLTEKE